MNLITRAKRDLNARRAYSSPNDRATGVICDQTIAMNGPRIRGDYPQHLRRIRFKDPETGKQLVFLTNHTSLPALTIAALYEARWQVELFFNPVLSLPVSVFEKTTIERALQPDAYTSSSQDTANQLNLFDY
jgi:Transposase DDE domain